MYIICTIKTCGFVDKHRNDRYAVTIERLVDGNIWFFFLVYIHFTTKKATKNCPGKSRQPRRLSDVE